MIRKLGLVFVLSFGFGASAKAADQIVGMAATIGVGAGINAGLNYAFGEKMEKTCSSGFGAFACPIAVMSFSQVIVDAALGDDAKNTENQARGAGGPNDFTDPNGFNDSAPAGPGANFANDAKDALKRLEEKGYKKNKDGSITGPNGKTASASALNSGQAMADSGLIDESQIEDYDKALADHKKKRDKIIVKSLGGGAKGGYKPKRRRAASTSDYGTSYNYGIDQSKIKAAKTSGLTKDFGGTPIGVASDDLFNMVSQRYNSLSEQKQFIDNPSGTYAGQR